MTTQQVETFWEAITMIEAQEQLKALSATTYPNMTNDDREDYHRELHEMAYPHNFKENKYVTAEQLQKLLG